MSVAVDRGRNRQILTGDRLGKDDITRIVEELREWSKLKITWKAVVSRVESVLGGRRFSRQALQAHPDIFRAFRGTKTRLRKGQPLEKRKPSAVRIAELQAENLELSARNDAFLEMYVTWLLNAKRHKIEINQLDAPLLPARLPSDYREAELARKEAERDEQLAKLKRLATAKVAKRLQH
ncbi:hypothetical protein GPL21_06980 [Bradyrhizobium pachyrhizi]|uniref:Uncharacterized protein n=1 Tax=Bradyrhizobium pachyrhizi TaxID=280333 RepID=A0A844SLB6_9BRAD|nr:hypothetical protein [Bradyrhizobium pachyrhizi]MVT64849.1 hypothetical protein [Bradyrhizobium pachyrhizi]